MRNDIYKYIHIIADNDRKKRRKAALQRIADNRADECQGDASGNPSRTCPQPAWLKGQAHPPRRGTATPAVRPPVYKKWKPVS